MGASRLEVVQGLEAVAVVGRQIRFNLGTRRATSFHKHCGFGLGKSGKLELRDGEGVLRIIVKELWESEVSGGL